MMSCLVGNLLFVLCLFHLDLFIKLYLDEATEKVFP